MSKAEPGRRRWLLALQVALSLGALSWLLARTDWGVLGLALVSASPALIALSCLNYFLGVGLSCLKWQVTLRVEGISLPLTKLFRWYLIGAFASNFLPTDFGGDLGRGYLAARQVGRPLAVARSILMERLSGLAFMLLLALAGVALLVPGAGWLLIGGVVAMLLVLALLALALRTAPASAARRLLDRLPARSVITRGSSVARDYLRRPGTLAQVLLISLVFQVLGGCGLWLNFRAVGAELPLAPMILTGAVAMAAGLLPVSLNGWGVREGVIVALLAPLGLSMSTVLAGALLSRALAIILSLPGGLLLATERAPRALEAEARSAGEL